MLQQKYIITFENRILKRWFKLIEKQTAILVKSPWLKITLLLTGSLTVMSGAVITAAIPDISEHFADSRNADLYSKLLLTLPSLFIAIFAPFAGRLIDHSGRLKVLRWALLLYAIGGTSGFFLSNIYFLLAGRALLGIAVAGIMTINTTLIGDYFQGKKRSNFMGWQGAFMGFGGVVFVSAGGVLADISWHWPFLVYSVSLVLLLMSWPFLYEPALNKQIKAISDKKRQVKNKKFLLLFTTAFFGMLFFYLVPTQIPFLLRQNPAIESSTIGFTISASVLAGALVSVVYGKIRTWLNFHQIYVLTFLLMGTGYLITAFLEGYSMILTGLIVAGLGTGMLMPNTNLWLVTLAPPERRGSMVGVLNTAVYSGQFLSPVFAYPFIYFFSIKISFLICGCIMLLISAWYFREDLIIKKNKI